MRGQGAKLKAIAGLAAAWLVLLVGAAPAEVLRASHQWSVGTGDFRDQALRLLAREIAAAKVGIEIKVSGGAKLFKPREQWTALQKGQRDVPESMSSPSR